MFVLESGMLEFSILLVFVYFFMFKDMLVIFFFIFILVNLFFINFICYWNFIYGYWFILYFVILFGFNLICVFVGLGYFVFFFYYFYYFLVNDFVLLKLVFLVLIGRFSFVLNFVWFLDCCVSMCIEYFNGGRNIVRFWKNFLVWKKMIVWLFGVYYYLLVRVNWWMMVFVFLLGCFIVICFMLVGIKLKMN